MGEHDRELLNKIMKNKKRYSIIVDNDAVHVQDNQLNEDDDNYWVTFDEYGYHFIVDLFGYLGFDSDYV
jgi:uncharacterized protein YacL (UPF0231 family)